MDQEPTNLPGQTPGPTPNPLPPQEPDTASDQTLDQVPNQTPQTSTPAPSQVPPQEPVQVTPESTSAIPTSPNPTEASTPIPPEQPIDFSQPSQSKTDLSQPFSWQAPEGLPVSRSAGWYIVFAVVVLVLVLLAIFVIKSVTFAILVPIMAVSVLVLTGKPPRIINYSVSPKGVYVADKLYDFSEFRSFGVIKEQQLSSAILIPVKRFAPGLTLYFNDQDGEQIVDMLGARLPMQEVKVDALEKFIRLIRL